MTIDIYLFIEKGSGGRISYIAKRYSEANKEYMKNYYTKKLSKFITYLDMNNLYGWIISSYLLYGGFNWFKYVCGFDVNPISEKTTIGCILEVDREYPDQLHSLHNFYQLAPEKVSIPYDILSNYCKTFAYKYGIKFGDVKNLIPNVGNKTNDVLHYRNLQLSLSLGMKLKKAHRVLKFKQYDWM